jgi:hypothetical protein
MTMTTAWQPIDTAPRNDYEMILVLVWAHDGQELVVRMAMWDPECADWMVFMGKWDAAVPVYWARIPEIPIELQPPGWTKRPYDADTEEPARIGGDADDAIPF